MNEMNEKYINNFRKIIQAETVSVVAQTDHSKFRNFHKLLAELFSHLWQSSVVEDIDGSLLIRWRGKAEAEPILLMNHHDVVEENGVWVHSPFGAEIEDGKIYGRGTIDTKSGLWAMLQAADDLAAEGFVPAGDIYFESACNEEISGEGADAVSKLLKQRGIAFELVLDEGSGIVDGRANIGIGEKGCTELKFIVRSEGGHASRVPKNSGLVRLGRFMAAADDRLDEIFPPEYDEATDSIQQTSIAFTMAEGSKGRNVLPTEANVIASMRSSHHQTVEASIKAICDFAKDFGIETEILDRGFTSGVTDISSKVYGFISELIRKQFGAKVKPFIMAGATDARYMSRLSECCLRFSPLRLSEKQCASVHATDENIDIAALEPAVEFFKALITSRI